MSSILFKAKLKDWKDKPNKDKWVEGYYLKRSETTYCVEEDYRNFPVKTLHFIAQERMTDWDLPNEFGLYEIDPDTLYVYMGALDEAGEKIWLKDETEILS